MPGVTGAAASTCGLIAGCSLSAGYRIEGAGEGIRSLYRNWVTPGYFATAGIPLQHGRAFTDRDNAAAPHVAIVNESAAQRYFPGGSPIGKRIWLGQVTQLRYRLRMPSPAPSMRYPANEEHPAIRPQVEAAAPVTPGTARAASTSRRESAESCSGA